MYTDTLATAKRLEQAGFDPKQAEALAQEHERMAQEIVRNIQAAFAPQFDAIARRIDQVEARFTEKLDLVETRLKGEFNQKLSEGLRDQLFKIVALFVSVAGLTLAGVVFALRVL